MLNGCPATLGAVAPRAGAWIETDFGFANKSREDTSHPVRVRGLKLNDEAAIDDTVESHPVRVRGLKPRFAEQKGGNITVAPRAGAWIETLVRHVE